MESTLLYYKSKGKAPERVKCVLIIGQSGKYNDEFLMLKDNNSVKQRIKLTDIEKLAQYPSDGSWEFGTRDGKTYRFRSQDELENRQWFDSLDRFVNKRGPSPSGGRDSQSFYFPSSDSRPQSSVTNALVVSPSPANQQLSVSKSNETTTGPSPRILPDGVRSRYDFYYVSVVQPLTEKKFLDKFPKKAVYELSIEEYAITLTNKANNKDVHTFRANVIRTFGFMEGYFCLELGRRSAPTYGPGFIVLKSTREESNPVHRHLYEITKRAFKRLKEELDRQERAGRSDGESDEGPFEEIDDDNDPNASQNNRPNQINYTTVYVPPQSSRQPAKVSTAPLTSTDSSRNPPAQQNQPQTKPQTHYLNIIRDDYDDTYPAQTQTAPPSQPKSSSKTTKLEIKRIDEPYQSNKNPTTRPPVDSYNNSQAYKTSSSTQRTAGDDYNQYMRGQDEMTVHRAVVVNNVYPGDNYNPKSSQQQQPGPQSQQSRHSSSYKYGSSEPNSSSSYPTTGVNGSAGRIGMTNGNNRTAMLTAGFDNSGFRIVEEIEHYESETDESFYEERYVPQYVSNRNLPSVALEYFNDNGNSIYGKVKL